ncbi:6168_t:CDS:2, partial [Racocetra fulgida]
YQLVIDRVFEEGEEELVSEDESDEESQGGEEEKVFLIDESLEFRKGQIEGLTTFAWRDLMGVVLQSPSTPKHHTSTPLNDSPVSASTTPVRSVRSDNSPSSTPTRHTVSSDFPGASSEVENAISVPVELHVFDPTSGTFVLMSQNATANWHVVSDDKTTLVQRVEPKMNPVFNR